MSLRADVAATLKRKDRPPIYLVYGEDAYSRTNCAAELAQALAAAAVGGADINRFEVGVAPIEEIVSAVMTVPMFGGARVVTVSKFEELSAEAQARFLGTLVFGSGKGDHGVAPDTTLIISSAAKSVSKKVVEAAGANVACFEFRPARAREAMEFVRNAARAAGLMMEYQAVTALVDLVGFDLGALGGEIEKLALFLGPGRRNVTADDIRAAVGANPTQSVWDLCDAVIVGDSASAHACLARMNTGARHTLSVQGTMASQFRLVLHARAQLDKGLPAPGGQNYRMKKAADQARTMSQVALARMISRLARADRELKTGVVGDELCMDLLISDLCEISRQAKQKPPR
jgi:DNA polymerase-3 subunit delta